MLSLIPARFPGSTRRALLAMALPAALATAALPSAADAATVMGDATSVQILDRSFTFGGSTERNDVTVRVDGFDTIVVRDTAGITTQHQAPGGRCVSAGPTEARCSGATSVQDININLADGDDTLEYRARHRGSVGMGDGVDTVFAGRRESSGQSIEPVTYFGGAGHDRVSYGGADRGVSLTPEDGLANDGRTGFPDKENVGTTFEEFIGSNFADAPFFGTAHTDLMDGGPGNDQIAGGGGADVFLAKPGDGADDYHGGPARDTILYSSHSTPVAVTLDNVANDGAAGERDQVRSNVENITGGSAGDTLRSYGAFSRLEGGGGADTLDGGAGPDTLVGGARRDRLDGGSGIDVVFARDGEIDDVDCGSEHDTATIDGGEGVLRNCESLDIGPLLPTSGTLRTAAGELEPSPVRPRGGITAAP